MPSSPIVSRTEGITPKARRSIVSRIKIGVVVCIAVALGLTAAGVIASLSVPDERVAANRAEQFALAVVSNDVGYAYDLLEASLQATISPQEFVRSVTELHPDAEKPVSVVATGFEPVAGQYAMDIFLEGERDSRRYYYRFRMSGSSMIGYQVAAFERLPGPPQLALAKIPPPTDPVDLRLPPANARLLLVPIEADQRHVEAVAARFREHLGLLVQILPEMAPGDDTADEHREQLIAEALLEQVRRAHQPDSSSHTDTVIGITGVDIYIRKNPAWRFAFSYRERPSTAVVSYARMDPRTLGNAPDEALLRNRLVKMIAKNVGLLMYGLPTSKDPKNILFDGILGVSELDFAELSFSRARMRPMTPTASQ